LVPPAAQEDTVAVAKNGYECPHLTVSFSEQFNQLDHQHNRFQNKIIALCGWLGAMPLSSQNIGKKNGRHLLLETPKALRI
jgi:hypothetical protein